MWLGKTADVITLVSIVKRMRERFRIRNHRTLKRKDRTKDPVFS
jgi:hypothetical protein